VRFERWLRLSLMEMAAVPVSPGAVPVSAARVLSDRVSSMQSGPPKGRLHAPTRNSEKTEEQPQIALFFCLLTSVF
jgi:hypothetical protein